MIPQTATSPCIPSSIPTATSNRSPSEPSSTTSPAAALKARLCTSMTKPGAPHRPPDRLSVARLWVARLSQPGRPPPLAPSSHPCLLPSLPSLPLLPSLPSLPLLPSLPSLPLPSPTTTTSGQTSSPSANSPFSRVHPASASPTSCTTWPPAFPAVLPHPSQHSRPPS